MPMYDRHCTSCDANFEVCCKHSQKEDPHKCPNCESTEGEWLMSAPAVSIRADRFMTAKKDNGFKEVIQKIQERNKRTEICKR